MKALEILKTGTRGTKSFIRRLVRLIVIPLPPEPCEDYACIKGPCSRAEIKECYRRKFYEPPK
jgi:hypothetical protein